MSIIFPSNLSSVIFAGIPWILRLFLLLYWSRWLFFWSISNNCSSNFLTLFWSFRFSSLRASMIVFLMLIMLFLTSSVTDFLRFFSISSNQALISENVTVMLSFNFSKEELNSDLKTDSSCFTPLSLVFGSAYVNQK